VHELARLQHELGHHGFTCATIREIEGMVAAGLGDDLLLANEVLDATRLGRLVADGARVTVAVDSVATIEAAVSGGIREVLIDINVASPVAGCELDDAAAWRNWPVSLVSSSRRDGLRRSRDRHRGPGNEGGQSCREHGILAAAHQIVVARSAQVGGPAAGSQYGRQRDPGGSYALMDTAYASSACRSPTAHHHRHGDLGEPKRLGRRRLRPEGPWHGPRQSLDARRSSVWYCSDEHIVFSPPDGAPLPAIGERLSVLPAHIDPTMAYTRPHGSRTERPLWTAGLSICAAGSAPPEQRSFVERPSVLMKSLERS